jgi:hypothetical protein
LLPPFPKNRKEAVNHLHSLSGLFLAVSLSGTEIGPQFEVVLYGEGLEYLSPLGDLRNAEFHDTVGRQGLNRGSQKKNLAALGWDNARYGIQECCLAGAISADQRDDLPFLKMQGDIFQGMNPTVVGVDVLYR